MLNLFIISGILYFILNSVFAIFGIVRDVLYLKHQKNVYKVHAYQHNGVVKKRVENAILSEVDAIIRSDRGFHMANIEIATFRAKQELEKLKGEYDG